MSTQSDRVVEQVQKWRDDLISLDRRNRLLFFHHTKSSSLELKEPSCDEILKGLLSKPGRLDFYEPVVLGADNQSGDSGAPFGKARGRRPQEVLGHSWSGSAAKGLLTPTSSADLNKILRNLDRQSRAEFIDKGLQSLYLGMGMVEWIDPKLPDEGNFAPLVLVPVELTRSAPGEPYRLQRIADDILLNPSLTLKMASDFALTMPPLEDDDLDLSAYFSRAYAAIRGSRGWKIHDRCVLSRFSFHKEAMYQDLLENEAAICAHPLIRALSSPDANTLDFDFDLPGDDDLDRVAPEASMVNILDADATQRRCIWAAREGRTFVMDGPPGTGKSQTISNMIAELLAAGRTVLFVSEKIAALEVVSSRLKAFGLDDYVLQLHSHKATRREVAKSLSDAVSRRPSANGDLPQTSMVELQRRRASLNEYAAAMNELRQPIGRSLSEVIGLASALHHLPRPAVDVPIDKQLTPETLAAIDAVADAAGRAWGPVERGDDFLWRDLGIRQFDAGTRAKLQEALARLQELNVSVASQLVASKQSLYGWEIGSGARALGEVMNVVQAVENARDADPVWLTLEDQSCLDAALVEVEELQQAKRNAMELLADGLGMTASSGAVDALSLAFQSATLASEATAEWKPSTRWSRETMELMGSEAQALVEEVHSSLPDLLRSVCDAAGIVAWANPTLNEVDDLVHLIGLAEAADRPELDWLNPVRLSELRQAKSTLSALATQINERHAQVLGMFHEGVMQLDAAELKYRFDEVHVGVHKASLAYLRDRKTIAQAARTGRFSFQAVAMLGTVSELQDLSRQLEVFEGESSGVLGGYYGGTSTNFDRLERAVEIASQALALAESRISLTDALSTVSLASSVEPAAFLKARALERILESIREYSSRAELDAAAIFQLQSTDLAERLGTVGTALGVWGALLSSVGELAGRGVSVGEAAAVGSSASECVACDQNEADAAERLRLLLGSSYSGVETDVSELRERAGRAHAIRAALGGSVSLATAERVLDSSLDSSAMGEALSEWGDNFSTLGSLFSADRRSWLSSELEADTEVAGKLLTKLTKTIDDIDEWLAHEDALRRLEDLGLRNLGAACVRSGYEAAEVPGVIRRVVLESWVDSVIDADRGRLYPIRSTDRDALREEFVVLDQALVRAAAGRVMKACNSRRPSKKLGAVSTILREGEKKKRHMPIRELLGRTREDSQALKPCFMMSPLSVSQFLPADFTFDVVLFDEASQIRPHDAANCIYRGKQHIIAGDQQQLPPTSFFAGKGDDQGDEWTDEDLETYESVLDTAKSCASIPSLPLLWHYRSQHEDLITFSNVSFYDGRLVSFPSPNGHSPILGIGFNKVAGVYKRGTSRDNPIEAQKVAELVAHYAKLHPDLSVGVVAFSSAQEDAIERAIDRLRIEDPELPTSFFSGERLDGFFVKNLETVQGDERDVIILSVGYGPDDAGKLTLSFGPINNAGGYRRLNVAITRARLRLELVTSFRASDVSASTENEGVRHLRNYLDYAEHGPGVLARGDDGSLGDVESPFEAEVVNVIRSWGYQVTTQLGCASYRIDMALVHPDQPGRHCLAIECDGAMYHSSRVARDRDKLREAVLRRLGWRIHRIWGPSWYRHRESAEANLRKAIEDSIAGAPEDRISVELDMVEPLEVIVDSCVVSDGFQRAPWVKDYVSHVPVLARLDLDVAMGSRSASRIMKRLIPYVVREEEPVSRVVVLDRLKEAWGVQRAGKNVQQEFDLALAELKKAGSIYEDAEAFLWTRPNHEVKYARRPISRDERSVRSCAQVSGRELDAAVRGVLNEVSSIGERELRRKVAEVFGWERVGADISRALDAAVARVETAGDFECRIIGDDDLVKPSRDVARPAEPFRQGSAKHETRPAPEYVEQRDSLDTPSQARCAVCHGRFLERSAPRELEFLGPLITETKLVHTGCLDRVMTNKNVIRGFKWDGARGGMVSDDEVQKSGPAKPHNAQVVHEPIETDIDLIREFERQNQSKLEENKKKYGGLYDSSPFD